MWFNTNAFVVVDTTAIGNAPVAAVANDVGAAGSLTSKTSIWLVFWLNTKHRFPVTETAAGPSVVIAVPSSVGAAGTLMSKICRLLPT